MTENQRPRVRTIKKAIAEIKAADPETAFTEGRLRKMIRAGTVPALKDGQRYLVDMNVLYAVIGAMPTQLSTTNIYLHGLQSADAAIADSFESLIGGSSKNKTG